MPQSRLVGTLLSPALNIWLRSQADRVESLAIEVKGSDRQILTGHIPGVALSAKAVIYQGLHLSDLQMQASTIRVNVGQVIRGKPLQLLDSIEVAATLVVSQDDLAQSVAAPLLANALVDIWQTLATAAPMLKTMGAIAPDPESALHLDNGCLELSMDILPMDQTTDKTEEPVPSGLQTPADGANRTRGMTPNIETGTGARPTQRMVLRTRITIVDGHILQLHQPQILITPSSTDVEPPVNMDKPVNIDELNGFQIDLGTDVVIQTLAIAPDHLHCQGQIWVRP
ncbi:MAG: DUF2993 domain-containing protein [Merismopedia sp. SIO2A8]|nr:DUF2993 domain-containing protein [Merismopedia sp. SIO2A8]